MPFGFGLITENLWATSMTSQQPERIDLPAFWRPFRTLFIITLFPSLAHPIAALHGFAILRCAYTFKRPVSTNVPKFEDKTTPEYIVYKRKYDPVLKKVDESNILAESAEIADALKVCGKRRGEYVEDAARSGISYFVMEKQTLNKAYMFRREKWAWSILSDMGRYVFPFTLCLFFFPAARRFNTDIVRWWKGAIPRWEVRHPIPNFFLSVNDYNRARHRITMRTSLGMPVSAKPWTPIK